MKPASFEYHAPHSLEEATDLLAQLGEDAKVLAGGQSHPGIQISGHEHRLNTGKSSSPRRVYVQYSGPRKRAPHKASMQHARKLYVVDKAAPTRQEPRILHSMHPTPRVTGRATKTV
jgi:hypothetical protein